MNLQAEREKAIHLLRLGHTAAEVAAELRRSQQWVGKCWRRYQEAGWVGLAEQSRAPHRHGRQWSAEVRRAVLKARSELEAEAARGKGLKYIGSRAVRTRLRAWQVSPLPSVRSIERILQTGGMTRAKASKPEVAYPHLQPGQPHQLCQVDHIPRYLQGGTKVFCYNAIDVVSRFPSGQVYARRRAVDAVAFLIHVWQTIGISQYTQVDNEGCFSGGFTHPYVLGQCVRLALMVGTELVFSPVRHAQSNGSVERFHQDYQKHVWDDTYLADMEAVQSQADHFFELYRHSTHHATLGGQTPHEVHQGTPPSYLPADFRLPAGKLPLYAGRVHFMRQVQPDDTVSVLNVNWTVPNPDPLKGVWVTLELTPQAKTLSIYDAAPDAPERHCLASYPFPVQEAVLPHPTDASTPAAAVDETEPTGAKAEGQLDIPLPPSPASLALWHWIPAYLSRQGADSPQRYFQAVLKRTAKAVRHVVETMY